MASTGKPNIHLYSASTANGIKASILLEELGLPYEVTQIDISKNTQKEPWFLKINPNGRIPALTDTFDDGKQIRIFESGSMLQYLVDRYDQDHKVSYPHGSREYWEVNNWLMWQMGGLGPMQGQAVHFNRFTPTKIEYGVTRYVNETRRLYRTLDDHLKATTSGYIVGDKVTIADIACWGWASAAHWSGIDLDEFPAVKSWMYKLLKRPGFETGRHVPTRNTFLDMLNQSTEEIEVQAAPYLEWVQNSMKDDAEK
ncbi:glutathione S-transferase domain-containing protein [Leptodontidium sp. MPI-SDFR-AT-0119]|nr:glutathione S-transferase domain-containing protein [Leptodontidium sp. MPI-SDFR-AT-0119]